MRGPSHTRSSDSRRSARRAPYRISAPHRQLLANCRRAQRKLAAAVPGVVRTSSSCACTQDGVPRGAGTTPVQREAPVWAVSPAGSREVLCRATAAAHHRRQLLSGRTARPFARECTSGLINIMTVPK